jgi:hypothetical protein
MSHASTNQLLRCDALRCVMSAAGHEQAWHRDVEHDRGRDEDYSPPPAQIRTGPIKAYGSHLGW